MQPRPVKPPAVTSRSNPANIRPVAVVALTIAVPSNSAQNKSPAAAFAMSTAPPIVLYPPASDRKTHVMLHAVLETFVVISMNMLLIKHGPLNTRKQSDTLPLVKGISARITPLSVNPCLNI